MTGKQVHIRYAPCLELQGMRAMLASLLDVRRSPQEECVVHLPGPAIRTLCHCILNYALSMRASCQHKSLIRQRARSASPFVCHRVFRRVGETEEMLTEDKCDILRRVVEIRSCQAVVRRFQEPAQSITCHILSPRASPEPRGRMRSSPRCLTATSSGAPS